jgi:isochorismate synthase
MLKESPTLTNFDCLIAWQVAQKMGHTVAMWRLPNQTQQHLIVNFDDKIETTKINFEELPLGFAVNPFQNPDGNGTIFIKADFYTNSEQSSFVETTNHHLSVFLENVQHKPLTSTPIVDWIEQPTSSTDYENAVGQAVRAIEKGVFQKVVLSRYQQFTLSQAPSVTAWFEQLCEAYPRAFVSLVFLPERNQIWLGASPETLVSFDAKGIFRTVSLAGTQSATDADGDLIAVKHASWTQKEIEEQAFVSRYVVSCFKKIRVREFVEEGPKTVVAGNLMHLRTDFLVDTQAIGFPEMATVMLDLLHPTSAVCGMPKAEAQAFIDACEGYDRELYSGYWGPINVDGASHLFVNLRCLKLTEQTVTLYAGAGITEDSLPSKEKRETDLKMQTLLRVLQ